MTLGISELMECYKKKKLSLNLPDNTSNTTFLINKDHRCHILWGNEAMPISCIYGSMK